MMEQVIKDNLENVIDEFICDFYDTYQSLENAIEIDNLELAKNLKFYLHGLSTGMLILADNNEQYSEILNKLVHKVNNIKLK